MSNSWAWKSSSVFGELSNKNRACGCVAAAGSSLDQTCSAGLPASLSLLQCANSSSKPPTHVIPKNEVVVGAYTRNSHGRL